ncbi:MAG: hypothetical protein Dbin4_01199 [Alphaproteobacteria bacterium]|nr:hypothetical protein [Alphaproteobacteria bacterium]
MAEEIHQLAGTQQAQHEQQCAHFKGQDHAMDQGLLRIGDSSAPQGAGHQQGGHRHRSHRQRPTGTQCGIENGGQHAGIKPCLGRQASEHGIGQALRNQQDSGDHARHEVIGKVAPPVIGKPMAHRQVGQAQPLSRSRRWGGQRHQAGWPQARLAGTATSMYLGLGSLRSFMMLTYASTELTCSRGL